MSFFIVDEIEIRKQCHKLNLREFQDRKRERGNTTLGPLTAVNEFAVGKIIQSKDGRRYRVHTDGSWRRVK